MNRGAWLLLPLLGAAGCVVAPHDPFARAHWALQRHDLGAALQAFDAVPVAHPSYPEARAAAVGVERTMRRCHELLLDALMLRGEWRDEEALAVLQKARAAWPSMPGVDAWIDATQQRLLSVGGVPPQRSEPQAAPPPMPLLEVATRPERFVESVPVAQVEPVAEAPLPDELPSPSDVALTDVLAAPPPEGGAESGPAPSGAAPVAPVFSVASEDPVALALVSVEARLREGQLASAVASLLELADRHPGEVRIRVRLSRLLQQRALLRYGEGAVHEAIVDWQRVLELEPENHLVRRMLSAAQQEGERVRRSTEAR